MKAYSLLELLSAPDGEKDAELFVEALRELLFTPVWEQTARAATPARDELRRRVDELRAAIEDPARGWRPNGPNGMIRRDYVEVKVSGHAITIDPVLESPFVVTFLRVPGGLTPTAKLASSTLATAVEEVDRRWPIARWWLEIDRVSP